MNDRGSMDAGKELNRKADRFYELLKDVEQKLYPGCETYTKLSFVINLFQVKCLHNMSDEILNQLLEIFERALPKPSACPKNISEAQKMIRDLGLDFRQNDSRDDMTHSKKSGEGIKDHTQQIYAGASQRIQEAEGSTSMSSNSAQPSLPHMLQPALEYVPGSRKRRTSEHPFHSNKMALFKTQLNDVERTRHEKLYKYEELQRYEKCCELEELVRTANEEQLKNRAELAALKVKVNGFLSAVNTMSRSFGSSNG